MQTRTHCWLVLALPVVVDGLGNTKVIGFATATDHMYKIHNDIGYESTVYCSCPYADKVVDLASCQGGPLTPRAGTGEARYLRTEAEHMVPANVICGKEPGWTGIPEVPLFCTDRTKPIEAGRACASLIAPCSFAYTDLHNLWPSVGGLNADRSDRPYVESIPGEERLYGQYCDFEVQFGADDLTGVELPAKVTGLAGRVSLYMYESYKTQLNIGFSSVQVAMFKRWNCLHRPTQQECARNEAVKNYQGNYNQVTKSACDNPLLANDPYCADTSVTNPPATVTTTAATAATTTAAGTAATTAAGAATTPAATTTKAPVVTTVPPPDLASRDIPFMGNNCPPVFFSQYYENGNTKLLELYNYASESVDLASFGLYLAQYTTTSTMTTKNTIFVSNPSQWDKAWDLTYEMAARSVLLLSKGTNALAANATWTWVPEIALTFNGDDTLALLYDSEEGTMICDLIACETESVCGGVSYVRSSMLSVSPTKFSKDFDKPGQWQRVALSDVPSTFVANNTFLGYHDNLRMCAPFGNVAATVVNQTASTAYQCAGGRNGTLQRECTAQGRWGPAKNDCTTTPVGGAVASIGVAGSAFLSFPSLCVGVFFISLVNANPFIWQLH